MSGGSFMYNSLRMKEFVEDLRTRLDDPPTDENHRLNDPEVREALERGFNLLLRASDLAHTIEYFFSDDCGKEALLTQLKLAYLHEDEREAELMEQARLLGMGAEREVGLISLLKETAHSLQIHTLGREFKDPTANLLKRLKQKGFL